MIRLILILFSFSCLLFSCKNDDASLVSARLKESKKREFVFAKITENWLFTIPKLQPQSQALVQNWPIWRQFVTELKQKPTNSIVAFQKKAQVLSKLAYSINKTIPIGLQKPAIKARLVVLLTHLRSLDLYVNLQDIPVEKALYSIAEINLALQSFQLQLDEIVRKSQIPIENGESDLIKILDTTRNVPNNQKSAILYPD